MADRDLTYAIGFEVGDTAQLATAATNMESLAEAADKVDTEEKTLTVSETGASEAAEALGQLGQAAEDTEQPITEAEGRFSGMLGTLTSLGIGTIGVAGAVDIVRRAVDLGQRAWDAYHAEQRAIEERSRGLAEELLVVTGALEGVRAVIEEGAGAGDPFAAVTAALEAFDPERFRTAQIAIGELGLGVEDLGSTFLAMEADASEATARLAESMGLPQEFVGFFREAGDSAEEFGTAWVTAQAAFEASGGQVTAEMQAQLGALLELRTLADDFDLSQTAEEFLEVARGGTEAQRAALAAAEAATGPEAGSIELWQEYVRQLGESSDAADDSAEAQARNAEEIDRAAQAAAEFARVFGGVDWRAAEMAGAESALAGFSEGLFAAGNATQEFEEAVAGLGEAMATESGDFALNLDLATEAGRRQQDALERLAGVLDGQFAQAYDEANGSQSEFLAAAGEIGESTLARLQDQLGLSAEEVQVLREQLGLTQGDYEARFELSGDAIAIERLGLLQGAISGLPETVQSQVSLLIAAGDPQAALELIIATLQGAQVDPVVVPTAADTSGAEEDLDRVGPPSRVEFETEADTSGAESDLGEVVDASYLTTVTADADTSDAAQTVTEFLGVDRPVPIYFSFRNSLEARQVADDVTADRTITVTIQAGSIILPSAAELARQIGTIRVPVDTYLRNTVRVSGRRLVAV